MEKMLSRYLRKVDKCLKPMPSSERIDTVKEIQSQILELQDDGLSAEEIIARLGDPQQLAKAYLGDALESDPRFSLKRFLTMCAFYSVVGLSGIIVIPTLLLITSVFIAWAILAIFLAAVKMFDYLFDLGIPNIQGSSSVFSGILRTNPIAEFIITLIAAALLFFIGRLSYKLLILYFNKVSSTKQKLLGTERKSKHPLLRIVVIIMMLFAIMMFFDIIMTSVLYDKEEETTSYSRIGDERYSIEICDDWEPLEYEYNEYYKYYLDIKGKQIFGISGLYPDFGESVESSINRMISLFDGEIVEELSEEKYDSDGTVYRTTLLSVTIDSNKGLMCLVYCEEKNTIMCIIARSYYNKDLDSTCDELIRMCDSIEFLDTPDMVTGNKFYMDKEKTFVELTENGTFLLYNKKEDDIGNGHVSGRYEVYRGNEAVEKVDSMTEYGLTKKEQIKKINGRGIFWDDYYAVIFYPDEIVQDGEKTETDSTILYIGYADEDHESLSMTACNKSINEAWTYAE